MEIGLIYKLTFNKTICSKKTKVGKSILTVILISIYILFYDNLYQILKSLTVDRIVIQNMLHLKYIKRRKNIVKYFFISVQKKLNKFTVLTPTINEKI